MNYRYNLPGRQDLRDAAQAGDLDFLPRVPLIPGITDKPDNLEGIAGFLKKNRWDRVQLLPYNPLWFDKCLLNESTIGPEQEEMMKNFMPTDKIEQCKAIFLSSGIEVV